MAERRKVLLPVEKNDIGRGELSLSYANSSMTINNGSESIVFASKSYIDRTVENYFDGVEYTMSGTSHVILFKHGDTVKGLIDADAFIKDGMVSEVYISGSSLVIVFNTEAGHENIELDLTEIFDPSNYYTKNELYTKDEIDASGEAVATALIDLNNRVDGVSEAVTAATMSSAATAATISNNELTIPTVAGPQGPQGPQGQDGIIGHDGKQGPQGPDGVQGFQGPVGPLTIATTGQLGTIIVGNGLSITSEGVLSATGGSGEQGPEGKQGPDGSRGFQGPSGYQGPQGANGSNGANGTNGKQGPQGPQGADGKGVSIKGSYNTIEELEQEHPTGNEGDAYMVGSDLYVWDDVNQEWKYVGQIKGDKGDQGPEGKQGPKGTDGTDGTNGTDGKQGPQGPQGGRGSNGTDGKQGPQGANGASGKGYQGPQGPDGTNGTDGKQGPQGPQGPKGADGTNGTDGKQGPQGANGSNGTNGTDGKQGPQGANGSNGTNGTDGKQGPQGPQGDRGFQGPKATTAEVVSALGGKYVSAITINDTTYTGTQGKLDIGDYLPLSGGKLTGPLSGTSAQFTGQVNATNGFFETSDANLKTFLEDVKTDEATVRAIPKKYFVWNNDELCARNIGTSAQAVQALYPELVSEIDGVLTVDYAKLSIIALAAIDNLQTQIDELKEKIKKLENK